MTTPISKNQDYVKTGCKDLPSQTQILFTIENKTEKMYNFGNFFFFFLNYRISLNIKLQRL